MATSVKGLLKGLRYISQMFDEKEPEMQIGLPTDVKHVAHIGWDGPSANHHTPTWMKEFKSPPEISSQAVNSIGDIDRSSANLPAQGTEDLKSQKTSRAPRSRRHTSTESSSSSDSSSVRRGSERSSRRHRSTCPSSESPTTQDLSGSSQDSRQRHGSDHGTDMSLESSPAIPKDSHRRKSRGSSGGGSTRSSRSKGQNSLTDIPLPILEVPDEEKG